MEFKKGVKVVATTERLVRVATCHLEVNRLWIAIEDFKCSNCRGAHLKIRFIEGKSYYKQLF